jgi:hypothetical protein
MRSQLRLTKHQIYQLISTLIGGIATLLPSLLLKPKIAKPKLVSHSSWIHYLSTTFNKPGLRILEIGSRNVTGNSLRGYFNQASYIGFDYYPGENVDVVGDAHQLASYFERESFDLIFSSAVFEHLAMPWVVAEEIATLLKEGGFVFIETHFSHSSHERPWHFFQFSDMGLRALFNPALGFEVLDAGMSNPIVGWFTRRADPRLRRKLVSELYCHSEILAQKQRTTAQFDWKKTSISQIIPSTSYPKPDL